MRSCVTNDNKSRSLVYLLFRLRRLYLIFISLNFNPFWNVVIVMKCKQRDLTMNRMQVWRLKYKTSLSIDCRWTPSKYVVSYLVKFAMYFICVGVRAKKDQTREQIFIILSVSCTYSDLTGKPNNVSRTYILCLLIKKPLI